MRRLLVIVLNILVMSLLVSAQNSSKLSYDDFRSWMKQSVVNGYTFVDADNSSGDYTASFMQLNKLISIKVFPNSKFDTYKSVKGYSGEQPYDFKGVKAVYVNGSSSSYIYMLSTKISATVVISTMYCKFDRQTMERMASDLGVGAKF